MKYTLLFIVMLMTTLLLCACNETEEVPPSEISTVYKVEEVELPDDFGKIFDMRVSGKDIILEGYSRWDPNDPEKPQTPLSITINSETGELSMIERVNESKVDSEGYRILSTTYTDSGEKFIIRGVLGDGHYEKMLITRYSSSDKELKSYDCEELFGLNLKHFISDELGIGGFYIQGVFTQDDYLYIVSNTGAVRIAKDDTHLLVESRNEITQASLTNGELIIFNGSNMPKTVNFETGKLDNLNLGDAASRGGTLRPFPVKGYAFGASISRFGIYGYTKTESGEYEETLLCDYNKSDISSDIMGIVSVSPQEYYIQRMDPITHTYQLYKLTMIKPEDIVEKVSIKLALFGHMDNNVQIAVSEFNLQNDKYHIDIVLYDKPDENSNNNYFSTDSITKQFEKDIISGNIPDIIISSSFLNYSSVKNYAEKGLFCDLYTLMDNAGWDKSQLLECVTESFESRNTKTGKQELLYLPLKSSVNTLYGRTADFSGRLTLDETLNRLDSLDENHRLMHYMNLSSFLRYTLEDYINYDTGEINFDTPLFRRYCEMYKRYLAGEFDKYNIDINGDDIYAAFREGVDLLCSIDLVDYSRYIKLIMSADNDELIQTGYPDNDGSGAILNPTDIFAITEKCEHKDAAFNFLTFYATDRYFSDIQPFQKKVPLFTTDMFERYIKNLPQHNYIADKRFNQRTEPYTDDEVKAMFGENYRYFYADDEFIEHYRETLLSARAEQPINNKIMAIVNEELKTYAERGNMPTDEVIKYINSRVTTYYNEQMK